MPTKKKTPAPAPAPAPEAAVEGDRPAGKLDTLIALLQREGGATLEEMTEATAWQTHSVRGAMAGALKKKGHVVTSQKSGNVRVYSLPAPEAAAQPTEAQT